MTSIVLQFISQVTFDLASLCEISFHCEHVTIDRCVSRGPDESSSVCVQRIIMLTSVETAFMSVVSHSVKNDKDLKIV